MPTAHLRPITRRSASSSRRPTRRPPGAPAEERYEPEPLPPLRRPGVPALLGWIGMAYAIVVVLAGTFGIRSPLGRLARGRDFVGGFGILMTRLPSHRPPDAGDGAVL